MIDVPPESQIHRQVVRKEAEIREIKIDPVVKLYYVEVEPPKMEDPTSDLRRLLKALEAEWELQKIKVSHSILEMLQPTLRLSLIHISEPRDMWTSRMPSSA